MADDPESLTLRYLRRIDERVERMEVGQRELRERLAGMETAMSGVQRDIVNLHHRIDELGDRIDRLGRRVDLVPSD